MQTPFPNKRGTEWPTPDKGVANCKSYEAEGQQEDSDVVVSRPTLELSEVKVAAQNPTGPLYTKRRNQGGREDVASRTGPLTPDSPVKVMESVLRPVL